MNKIFAFLIILLFVGLLSINSVVAITVDSIEASLLTPGSDGTISLIIENNLDEDADDVSLQLQFAGLPLTPSGSSEQLVSEIDEGDKEKFSFRVRVASDARPGDYELPYTLNYKQDGSLQSRKGSLGIRISGEPELAYSLSADKPVENQQSKISLKIVNRGFADARFASVKIITGDFVLLSEEEVYLGTIDSDDFETAEFEVLFDRNQARFKAAVEYKDFENQDRIEQINLPITIYSREEALRLGIIKQNNAVLILGVKKFKNGKKLTLDNMCVQFGMDPKKEPCFYSQDWYVKEVFAAKRNLKLQWCLVSKGVQSSTRGREPARIKKSIKDGQSFPSAVLAAYTFFAYYFHTKGELLWKHDFIWCSDRDGNGDHIYVGRYYDPKGLSKKGFNVHRHLRIRSNYGLAMGINQKHI